MKGVSLSETLIQNTNSEYFFLLCMNVPGDVQRAAPSSLLDPPTTSTLRSVSSVYISCKISTVSALILHVCLVQIIAKEIAADELAHVVFLRTALGSAAVAMPQVRFTCLYSSRHLRMAECM